MEEIGWISTVLLGACGIPLAIASIRSGNSEGISRLFLWTWLGGEILGLVYASHLRSMPLLANYWFNSLLISIVLYYSYYPRESK